MSAPTTCRSCDAPIVWALTFTGKRMPVDAEPPDAGDGNVVLTEPNRAAGELHPRATVLGPLELEALEPAQRAHLRTSHFATCPDADTWRH